LFKSTFAKYITAFIVILLLSFIVLTSIVTSTIRHYVKEEREASLQKTCESLSKHIAGNLGVQNLEYAINSGSISMIITPMVNREEEIDIILTDAEGRILLTSVNAPVTEHGKIPVYQGNLGSIEIEALNGVTENEITFLEYTGTLSGISSENVQLYAKEIITADAIRGYAVAISSTEEEDAMVGAARRAMLNSALWVMLAAAIAVYFITERIIHPLKSMTSAAKSFAKGDFSSRVDVYGSDEIAELAEAFNNMAEALDSFERMRNSFLASVSHDLRTPMTTISGFIEGITSGAIPPEKHDYYLGIISAEVHRLSRLVTDLLDISRLESGERKFNFESFDIAEVARIILISFEQKIEEKKLDVIFETDSDTMTVIADKDAIHQVVYNLCHNAIKFSKVGGKLAISITRFENKKIKISVYDEGQSISLEELPLVFDRFYKTDKSRGLDKSGVGLGLYICKTIIDAHGEEIHAESPNENGSEFWFTLKEGDIQTKRR